MKIRRNREGFTIIELLVVMMIIGIITAIALPQYTKQVDKAKKSRAMVEIKSMKNAMEIYYAENSVYPTGKAGINAAMRDNDVLGGKYGNATDPWGQPYYIATGISSYIIWSEGPDTADTAQDDIYTDNSKTDVTANADNIQTTAVTNSKDST